MNRKTSFLEAMQSGPLALHTDAANEQHYEVPSAFYTRVLGPRLKYSSCLWSDGTSTLAESEEAMLALTVERAGIRDGMNILELGCGWGSLSLYMAQRFPEASITAVSNSRTQKAFIDNRASELGLANVEIVTADMNGFETSGRYDRVVSVEMFEHMRNYRELLRRVAGWLTPEGKLFVHIFVHDHFLYPFETDGDSDWMARYFFTGGLMPSFDVFQHFTDDLQQENCWKVNGTHYEKTLNAWLVRMDAAKEELLPLFRETYGPEWKTWWVYWRIFFMACAELFGFRDGREWYVGHYLLGRAGAP